MGMSNFGEMLAALTRQSTQQDLADKTKLGKSTISRIISGDIPKRTSLPLLIEAATTDPLEKAQLLRAYLADVKEIPGIPHDLIHISVGPPADPVESLLSPDEYTHIRAIAEALNAGHKELYPIIESAGELAARFQERHNAIAAEDPAVYPKKKEAETTQKTPSRRSPAPDKLPRRSRAG